MPVAKNGRLPYNISIASTARPSAAGKGSERIGKGAWPHPRGPLRPGHGQVAGGGAGHRRLLRRGGLPVPHRCGAGHRAAGATSLAVVVSAGGGTGDRGLLQADKDGGPGHQRHHRRGTPRKAPVHLAAAAIFRGQFSPTCAAAAADGRARLSRWAAPSAAMRGTFSIWMTGDLRTGHHGGHGGVFLRLVRHTPYRHGVRHRGHQHRAWCTTWRSFHV